MKKLISVLVMVQVMTGNSLPAQELEGVNAEHLFTHIYNVKKPVIRTIKLQTGVEMEYAEQGDISGVPVILLHGFSDSWHSYEMIMPYLPSSYHVFAVSLRGHGNSSKKGSGYHPEDFAKDIAAFIKQKKLNGAIIAGHSMGSTIAQCFAVRYPSLTRALVLLSSFSDYNKPGIEEFGKVIDGLNDPVDSVFVAEFQKSTVINPISDEMLNLFISESRKLPARVWKGVAAGWSSSDFCKGLQSFGKPALIVWGDKDSYCPRKDQEILLKSISQSELLVYENVGHALHWEKPERFAADLVKFINGITEIKGGKK